MRAVLISGAATGIGRAATLRLAQGGFRVFAGVRKVEAGQALAEFAGPSVVPLTLDVTDVKQIEAARATIESHSGDVLYGVVNNAGMAVAGPLEGTSDQDVRAVFDVNFFGALSMIRTFAPLLRESRGRIVNVSSVSGKLSSPYNGVYSASKFALEAVSDALRVELHGAGIRTILIEPGPVKTPFWQSSVGNSTAAFERIDPVIAERHRPAMTKLTGLARRAEASGVEPDAVAIAIERALTDANPRARYGVNASQITVSRLPDGLRDRILLALIGSASS